MPFFAFIIIKSVNNYIMLAQHYVTKLFSIDGSFCIDKWYVYKKSHPFWAALYYKTKVVPLINAAYQDQA